MTTTTPTLPERFRRWWTNDTTARDAAFNSVGDATAYRRRSHPGGRVAVNADTAQHHSAYWAALRLRANLISSLPVDGFRKLPGSGIQVEAPLSPLFETPCGDDSFWDEWVWATQYDLDRYGVTVGVITERFGTGLPARIDLLPAGSVRIKGSGWQIEEVSYRGTTYTGPDLRDIYIEHQYRIAGVPVGLDPIAAAAWSIGSYLSASQFIRDYFGNGAFPSGTLRNTVRTIPPEESGAVRDRFVASVADREPAVFGKDWERTPAAAPEAADAWLNLQQASAVDLSRYLDVPADLIDAAVSGQSITYANMSQRNTQALVMSLGPAINRRERRWSRLLPRPRFVKLNTDAFLRMDPETRARVLNAAIAARRLAPSEVRALDNNEPFTPEQIAEFAALFGDPNRKPQSKEPAA